MIMIIFLIAAISLDTFSFGLAQGFKKNKLTLINTLIMTILSTILFTIPLYLSDYVFRYFKEDICNIINGSILILLGIYYILSFLFLKKRKIEDENVKINTLCLKFCILSTFPINLDAIFTAFLNGYSVPYIIVAIIIFFVFTFFSLLIPNRIALKLSNKSQIDLSWFSGIIFLIIGTLKTFGI